MTKRWAWLLAMGELLLGCGDPSGASSSTRPSSTSAPPAFSGPLTAARVLGAEGLVRPLDRWLDAERKLETQLGPPTRVSGGFYQWAVLEGDACVSLQIERVAEREYVPDGTREEVVGLALSPVRARPADDPISFKACLEILREAAQAAPSTAALPAEAAPLALDELRRDASRWAFKRVRLKALLKGITSTTMRSGQTSVELRSATLIASQAPGAGALECALRAGTEPPPLATLSAVLAEGVVGIDDSGAASLQDCTLTASP